MGKIHDRFKGKANLGVVGTAAVKAIVQERKQDEKSLRVVDYSPPYNEGIKRAYALEEWEIGSAFNKQKYIVAVHPDLGEVALTFPNFLVHAKMARAIFSGLEIKSAGFFNIHSDMSVSVYGRSESLNLGSRGEQDAALIERTLGIG